jgi:hypothetical protein
MRAGMQPLKPETAEALRDLPYFGQYNNWVRIAKGDVQFWLEQGRSVLTLKAGEDTGRWERVDAPITAGKHFVYWGD